MQFYDLLMCGCPPCRGAYILYHASIVLIALCSLREYVHSLVLVGICRPHRPGLGRPLPQTVDALQSCMSLTSYPSSSAQAMYEA